MNLYDEIISLNQSALHPRAKALYLALMELAGSEAKCKPILVSLKFKSGLSESTVIRATKELEAADFISVLRFPKRGPSTFPNVYTLNCRKEKCSQIDSTSPVKMTDKNIINKDKDTSTSLTTNACHHDTRGVAPGVMSDRLVEYENMLTTLKKFTTFVDHETESEAFDVVDLIGLDEMESELQKRRNFRIEKGEYQPPILMDLQDIKWEIKSASLLSEELEQTCTGS